MEINKKNNTVEQVNTQLYYTLLIGIKNKIKLSRQKAFGSVNKL